MFIKHHKWTAVYNVNHQSNSLILGKKGQKLLILGKKLLFIKKSCGSMLFQNTSWHLKRCSKYSFSKYIWKIPQNFLLLYFTRKKVIQVWTNMRENKWWQSVNFWVNFPFNVNMTGIKQIFVVYWFSFYLMLTYLDPYSTILESTWKACIEKKEKY